MLILVWKENEQNQAHIFQDTYFESSQIHESTIMYRFEPRNHDILNFLIQNLYKLTILAHFFPIIATFLCPWKTSENVIVTLRLPDVFGGYRNVV